MNITKLTLAILMLSICLLSEGCNNKPEVKPAPGISFSIAPNPATDAAYVYGTNPSSQPYVLQIYDTKGKKIAEQNFGTGTFTYSLPLSDQPKGNYQIILKTPAGAFTKKLIKI